MILHFSHMGLTDARTFTLRDPPLKLGREQRREPRRRLARSYDRVRLAASIERALPGKPGA
jgi:hypothetical protein